LSWRFSYHRVSPPESPDLPQFCRNPARRSDVFPQQHAMQDRHSWNAIRFATFCAVNDADFSLRRTYMRDIRQPRRVASDF
jgi:hypothetical protein